jgi:LysR family transcriptional regulator, cell division regulator
MDVADLKTFEAVVRHGSMNKAAQELHTVQSNVTARIQALEQELGVALFQRHARGVNATPAGQRILPFVARISKLLAEAESAAKDDGTPHGVLTLGGLETTMALRLSPVLSRFAKNYPDVRLAIRGGTTESLLRQVVENQLDGAFVAGPLDHPEIVQERVFTEELVLVTSRAIQSLKELAKVPDPRTIVFQLGCSYRQRLETILGGMGIITAKPLEFGSLDTIINCVSAGIGVTLLPRAVVAKAEDAGLVTVHALPRRRAQVETLFIRRHDAYVSSAMTAFLAVAKDVSGTRR